LFLEINISAFFRGHAAKTSRIFFEFARHPMILPAPQGGERRRVDSVYLAGK
jgi:hypothetical protein